MEKKWTPCFCTMLLGLAVLVFTWWQVAWAQIALTVVGVLVILKGLIGVCCCRPGVKGESKSGGCCGGI